MIGQINSEILESLLETIPFEFSIVDANDKVDLRRVTVGQVIDGRSIITKGLEDGELVITEGINKVRPGLSVDAAASSGTE